MVTGPTDSSEQYHILLSVDAMAWFERLASASAPAIADLQSALLLFGQTQLSRPDAAPAAPAAPTDSRVAFDRTGAVGKGGRAGVGEEGRVAGRDEREKNKQTSGDEHKSRFIGGPQGRGSKTYPRCHVENKRRGSTPTIYMVGLYTKNRARTHATANRG